MQSKLESINPALFSTLSETDAEQIAGGLKISFKLEELEAVGPQGEELKIGDLEFSIKGTPKEIKKFFTGFKKDKKMIA